MGRIIIKSRDQKTKLTIKEKTFIREYCKDFNGTRAAIKAGYSKKSAGVIASQNLNRLNIKLQIKEYLNSILGQYKDTLEYEIINTYKVLAFYNPDDIIDKNGLLKVTDLSKLGELSKCIKGIETKYNSNGDKQVIIKLADREQALDKLAQYMSLLKQEIKIEQNINNKIEHTFDNKKYADILKLMSENETITGVVSENRNIESVATN